MNTRMLDGVGLDEYPEIYADKILGITDELENYRLFIKNLPKEDNLADDIPMYIENCISSISEAAAEMRHVRDWIHEDWADNDNSR